MESPRNYEWWQKLVFLWDLKKSNNQNWSQTFTPISRYVYVVFFNWEVYNLNLADIELQQKNCVNNCHNELQSVWKLRTYNSFKSDFNFARYVTMNIPNLHRPKLYFKCGVLCIRIETGRIKVEKVNNYLLYVLWKP